MHERVRLFQQHAPDQLRRDRGTGAEGGDTKVGPPLGDLPGRAGPDLPYNGDGRLDGGVPCGEAFEDGWQEVEGGTAEGSDAEGAG